jgi:hypothetical protein
MSSSLLEVSPLKRQVNICFHINKGIIFFSYCPLFIVLSMIYLSNICDLCSEYFYLVHHISGFGVSWFSLSRTPILSIPRFTISSFPGLSPSGYTLWSMRPFSYMTSAKPLSGFRGSRFQNARTPCTRDLRYPDSRSADEALLWSFRQ